MNDDTTLNLKSHMTTFQLFWFLLKNLILCPKCANKVIGTIEGTTKYPHLGEISCAVRIKNVGHVQELWFGEMLRHEEEENYKNTIVLG